MSMNVADSEMRPVLGLAGNKSTKSVISRVKPTSKSLLRKVEKSPQEITAGEEKRALTTPPTITASSRVSSILCKQEQLLRSNSLSLNASCSSDASSDSFHSRGSTGRISSRTSGSVESRRKLSKSRSSVSCDGVLFESSAEDGLQGKKRCAWVTPNADPAYAAFHDKEWGVPQHDDKKLFELLVLSGALAELPWPAILSKRHIFREVFSDFDPISVAKMSEKKTIAPGSTASSLLSDLKLRSIIENARQISKVVQEFGSFDKYIWAFVNHKPIVSRFRNPRQVPVKTPKADVISKDLVRRGFRSVSPTVIYSFMQVAGITNDHLVGCFRFHDCLTSVESKEDNIYNSCLDDQKTNDVMKSDITRAIDELSFTSE